MRHYMTITANYRKITRLAIAYSETRGVTTAQLTKKSGVSRVTIWKIKNGASGNLETHAALIMACGFKDFDITYPSGTVSKVAFYCPNIKTLNEEILPVIKDWYGKNRKGKEDEIFRYYSSVTKENKAYELPNENLVETQIDVKDKAA
jgi:transcriptional regulator with XRE-family HTH domain